MLLARSKWKVFASAGVLAFAIAVAVFLPERWFDRIATISQYEQDGSAVSRLMSWKLGWQLALDHPVFGGGFRVFEQAEVWIKYMPEYFYATNNKANNAHSIYFHVLGEHGFTGFLIFISLILSSLLYLRQTRRYAKLQPDGFWIVNYTYMAETSICAFLVTGAFQNLSYFDFFYFQIAVAIILGQLVRDISNQEKIAAAPRGTRIIDTLAVSSEVA
jgi:probable O-glycosylation ligase (exosortase A-associated)